ncbi:hypothetical protein EDB92DRAFT_734246 [Lactarius akahatsu]|uniref:Uncharacterized protein n=1 Tax=Lactarius akahatsu TaxID=416441 RepID=A0AAD4L879_9AGAM|nr:hypothetical protein EDB92DRAFT_734246 [Lactarius akahatsu]
MILGQRVGRTRLWFRGYNNYALQQRITHLLKFVSQHDNSRDDKSWAPVTRLALDSAIATIESVDNNSPPTWLLVRLCSKVRSQTDAEKASHLIVTNLPYISPDLRPPVLILVVHLLSAYKVLPSLDRVVKLFIGLPIFHEYWHFNRLLRALMQYTDSPTDGRIVGRLAVLLLKTMTERELTLTKKTYRFLLQNRYVTMELSEELRQRMIRDKIVPDRAHLESFLRISANRGSVHDAAAYAREIQTVDRNRQVPPHVATSEPAPSNATVEYLSHLVHEHAQRTDLVAFFEWSHAQRFPFRTHTTLSYTIVLHALLRKGAYPLALEVWERYRKHGTRKLRLDPVALGVGVEVLARSRHPDRALVLVDAQRTPRTAQVPSSVVTRLMRVLAATNPSAALRLWEHMGILYGTAPDAHAFSIMLGAARCATLNGDSLAGAMQELGIPFRVPFSRRPATPPSSSPSSLDRARRTSYAQLKRALVSSEGDMWGSERAWRRAYRIFTDALLAAWPALAQVRAPAHAVRASGDGAATAPLRDLGRFLVPRSSPVENEKADAVSAADDDGPPPPLLPVHTHAAGYCPSFAPDDATFRAAVLLLGAARAAGEIPLVLAWMRALGVVPRTRTLAYALVFWAEVSVGAPLLERLRGAHRGEYVRFVRWMEEWVGVANVPDDAAIGEAMRRVDGMRRGQGQKQQLY